MKRPGPHGEWICNQIEKGGRRRERKKKTLTLSGRVGRYVIGARCCTADAVGRPRRVRQQRFAERGKGALELARKRWQIVNDQRELEQQTKAKDDDDDDGDLTDYFSGRADELPCELWSVGAGWA